MKIAIGGDHAGFQYKAKLVRYLIKVGYEVIDKGSFSDASVDYPDFAHSVAIAVETHVADFGIVICGSGNGVCMSVNKHAGVRGALCWNVALGELARMHNDANVLCIPARFVSYQMAKNIAKAFLSTTFEGGRHKKRVNKI